MPLKSDLDTYCYSTFRDVWEKRNGTVVPSDASLKLSNDGINLTATVLYADLADSTVMVDKQIEGFSAEVYKNFLYCAARIIRANDGTITAYDGDRIMAVFIGESKNTSAVKAALQINWAVKNIVQVQMKAVYSDKLFTINHVVGIDTSDLFVAKTGIRGSNDLVWVGRAANYAAKLSALSHARSTYITAQVYGNMHDSAKLSSGTDMWTPYKWNTFDDRIIYGSTYSWSIA